MLCSAAELELSDDHDGIIELPDDAPVGHAYAAYAGLDDPVIDDQSDAEPARRDRRLRHRARSRRRRPWRAENAGARSRSPALSTARRGVTLDFAPEDTRLCPRFALRLVRGVQQRRFARMDAEAPARDRPAADQRAGRHHQLLTFDRGRPLHVFDAAKVAGALRVRRARAGESVLALDGKTYALDDSMVVIADDNGVESIAGVMGGEHSGCDETTRDVLIESALWDPLEYRADRPQARHRHRCALSLRARRRSGLLHSRRANWRRGWCSTSAAASPRGSSSPATRTNRRASSTFPYSEVEAAHRPRHSRKAKARRSCARSASTSSAGKVTVPSVASRHRRARPTSSSRSCASPGSTACRRRRCRVCAPACRAPVLTPLQKRTRLAKRTLAALGLREAVTWSFISKAAGGIVRRRQSRRWRSPIRSPPIFPTCARALFPAWSPRPSAMRGAAQRDVAPVRGRADFPRRRRGRPARSPRRRCGAARPRRRARAATGAAAGSVDVFDAKSDAMALLAALGVPGRRGADRTRRPRLPASRPFGDAAVRAEERHRLVRRSCIRRARGARRRRAAGRLRDHSRRHSGAQGAADARPRPKLERSEFMPVERDLAFVVAESVARRRHPRRRRWRADRALIAERRRLRRLSRARACRRAINPSRSR